MTEEYSEIYLKVNNKKEIDRQLWAALHLGFITGARLSNFSSEEIDEALKIAQDKLLEKYPI